MRFGSLPHNVLEVHSIACLPCATNMQLCKPSASPSYLSKRPDHWIHPLLTWSMLEDNLGTCCYCWYSVEYQVENVCDHQEVRWLLVTSSHKSILRVSL